MSPKWCKDHVIKGKTGALLLLAIQPGASRSCVKGLHGDRLKISIKAPPVDGAANLALIEFLSDTLDVSKSRIHVISGETSRQKNLWVEGTPALFLMTKLSPV